MATVEDRDPGAGMPGLTLHAPMLYDLSLWLLTLGREHRFREKLLALAELKPGEAVLDVGCGTGSLTLAAKRQVGAGQVFGIDASPEMLGRAERKARKAGLDAGFRQAPAQALPFADASFDVVLSSLMLHHLPRDSRRQCATEMRRVLGPGGRVLAVDFAGPAGGQAGHFSHFHRHGGVSLDDLIALFWDAGFKIADSGGTGFADLRFVLATSTRSGH